MNLYKLDKPSCLDCWDSSLSVVVIRVCPICIDNVRPRLDTNWQAQTKDGFDLKSFAIDWQRQQVICPTGHTNVAWRPKIDDGDQVIEVRFAASLCKVCPLRMQCTHAKNAPRMLKLRPLASA